MFCLCPTLGIDAFLSLHPTLSHRVARVGLCSWSPLGSGPPCVCNSTCYCRLGRGIWVRRVVSAMDNALSLPPSRFVVRPSPRGTR